MIKDTVDRLQLVPARQPGDRVDPAGVLPRLARHGHQQGADSRRSTPRWRSGRSPAPAPRRRRCTDRSSCPARPTARPGARPTGVGRWAVAPPGLASPVRRWGRKTSEARPHVTKEPSVSNEALSNLLHEERTLPAQRGVRRRTPTRKADLYEEAADGPAGVLGRAGATGSTGRSAWDARRWTGRTRRSRSGSSAASSTSPYNCVDRHVEAGHGDRVAIHWEGEPGDTRDDHLRRPAARGLQGRQRAHRARRREPATGSRSTCR